MPGRLSAGWLAPLHVPYASHGPLAQREDPGPMCLLQTPGRGGVKRWSSFLFCPHFAHLYPPGLLTEGVMGAGNVGSTGTYVCTYAPTYMVMPRRSRLLGQGSGTCERASGRGGKQGGWGLRRSATLYIRTECEVVVRHANAQGNVSRAWVPHLHGS